MLIDTHAHLYFEQIKVQYEDILKRAVESGVGVIINIGVDVERSKSALEISKKEHPSLKIYSTIGIHPHDVETYANNTQLLEQHIAKLEKIYSQNPDKVVAVGECGLDFKGDQLKDLQGLVFQAQINLAKKLNLPLSVHSRESWDEILGYLEDTHGVFHCYSGDLEITKKVLETSYYISFAGNLTYKQSEHLRESAKIIPLERILIETDSPFLAPQSKRGQANEPANVKEVAQCLAEIKGILYEEIENQTTQNAKILFKL